MLESARPFHITERVGGTSLYPSDGKEPIVGFNA
jgi:hypothetical protein